MQTIQERILNLLEERVNKADLSCYRSPSPQTPNGGAIYVVDSEKNLYCLFSMAYYFDALSGKIEFFLTNHAPQLAIQGENPTAQRSCQFWYHSGKTVVEMLRYLDEVCTMAKNDRKTQALPALSDNNR